MNRDSETGAAATRETELARVLVTGASGFVGRAVTAELVRRGHKPVCLVRDRDRFRIATREHSDAQIEAVQGDLFDRSALAKAAEGADAAIHLVGIIAERRLAGQTFERVHVEGTRCVVEACKAAGVRRYLHMSALGTRDGAVSRYHRTKWAAECLVRDSGLDWTIFQPSAIHGPDGEFMRMMRQLVCDVTIPVFGFVPVPLPFLACFGSGQNRLQPVFVADVAHCVVAALAMPGTIGQTYEFGGPEAMTWRKLYAICRETLPGAKWWKPVIGVPVWLAKLKAQTAMKLPLVPPRLRFNVDQVQMSQEDSVCDIRPVEETFGIKLRGFREELARYADEIR